MNSTKFWAVAFVASVAMCAHAELRISEICPKPNTYDSKFRSPGWIEFYNDGAEAVDLADYELVRANRGKAAAPGAATKNLASRTVPAGGYTVVYTTEDWPNANSGVVEVYQESAYGGAMMVFPNKINNKKYPLVRLYKGSDAANKVLVDEMVVPVDLPEGQTIARAGGSFPAFDSSTGVANPDAYTAVTDASAVKSVILPTPTKGAANNYTGAVPYGPNAGPLYGVAHKLSDWAAFPAPAAGQDYAVTLAVNPATAAAGDAIASVTLLYRCGEGQTNMLAMAQGTSDATAGQSWTASIPAADLPAAGQLVRWAAQITDAAGNTWRTPSFRDPELGYQWYGTMMPAPALESATLQTFHLFVTGNSVAQMDVDADNQNKALVPYNARCDIFDSSTGYYYDNVRIDLRGNTTANFRKKSHGLRFNKSQPLTCTDPVTGAKVKEIRKTSFIAEYSDPALVRQALSFKVFKDAGLDVPFDYPVRLNLNGQFYQLAWHSNRFTDELIEDYYGYDAKGYAFKSVGDLGTTSTAGSKKKVTPDDDNENDFTVLNQFQNLISGVTALSDSFSGDGMDSEVPAVTKTVVQKFDLPAWINYLAAARITHECDDIWANLCVYWDVNGTDTWKPLAYDLNQSWGVYYKEGGYTDNSGVIATNDHFKSHPLFGGLRIRTHQKSNNNYIQKGNRGFECIYQSPKFRRMYLRRLRTLMDEQLKAPGTAKADTPFWDYVTMLQNACYAEDILDNAKWGYGNGTVIYVWPGQMELQQGIDDLWDNYVVPRRQHLFVTHSVTNAAKAIGYGEHFNAGIPLPQSPVSTLAANFSFGNLDSEGVLQSDALVISNRNAEAVDMSGWTLSGTMNYAFPAGTVVDANDAITVVADRKAYVADNASSLTDQVIVGNGRHNPAVLTLALLAADGTAVAESGPAVRTDNYRNLRLHSFDGVATNAASGDAGEWIVLTNLSDSVALDLEGVHVVFCKTGDAAAKCDFTIGAGVTIPAGGSIRLDQADYAASGWAKITNGNLDIAIYDEAGDTVQSGKVVQGDFPTYKNESDPLAATYLVLGSTAHTFASADFAEEYYFEQPEPEVPPKPVLGRFSAPFTVTGYTGATPLEDFPVLVRLAADTPEAFDYADCAANGADLRFADENGDQIPCEIQSWDTTGESLVWVRLPVLTNNAAFTMWYGGTDAANYATNTWDRFVGVWHMDEASGPVADATGHGLAATPQGNTANSIALTDAPTGTGRQTATSAAKGYLSVPSYDRFACGGLFTISGWVKITGCTGYPRLFSRKNNYTDPNGWECELHSGNAAQMNARGVGNSPTISQAALSPTLLNNWAHITLVYDGATLNIYQNGALVKSGSISAATDNALPLSFGCDSDGSETYAQGAFDECRLMRGAASADWVKAEYDQIGNAAFLTAGRSTAGNAPILSFDVVPAYTNAALSLSLTSIGEGATGAWVSFAMGTDEDNLPAPTALADGAAAGWTLATNLSGLANGATYYYAVTATNDLPDMRPTILTGSFTTLAFSAPELTIEDAAPNPEARSVSATIGLLGGGSSCDLYFSYGVDGQPFPAYTQVATGLASGATFSRTLTELESGVEYAYSFIASNDMGRATQKTGYFTPGIDFRRPDKNVAEFVRGVKFTVTGYAGTSVLTNFPVLVRLSENSPTGFTYDDFYSETGEDLCFLDAAGNGIPHEIDTWNTSGESLVWVTLPTMTNGTEFAMWYRSSKSGSVICDDNAWNDFVGVWHLNEGGDGVQAVYDSTTNALEGVTHANSLAQSQGRVGASRRVSTKGGNSAANGRILVPLSDSAKRAAVDTLAADGGDKTFTASLWMRPRGGTDYCYMITRKVDDKYAAWGVQFNNNSSGTYTTMRVYSAGTADSQSAQLSVQATARDIWRKIDIVWSGTTYTVYYDGGALKYTGTLNSSNGQKAKNGSSDLSFGGTTDSGYGSFNGEMDEIRLRVGANSADWVKAEYDNIVNANFLNGGEVVSFVETPRPIGTFALADTGAKYAQFSGSIGSCGGEATACDFLAKVWPTAGSEPSTWTNLVSGVAAGATFTGTVTGLDPETAYSYKLKIVNNLATPYDSEIAEGSFTTGGTGAGGVGGDRYRIGDDYVHVFAIDPDEGVNSFTFTPPDYVTSIQALVVAGGGPGGYRIGGGGGAGGLIYDEALAVTGGATYTVNVGTGGVASASETVYGISGGNSSIYLGSAEVVTALGGGAGGNYNSNYRAGRNGGSGGGAMVSTAAVGDGTSGQGNAGGIGNTASTAAGGGGGAGRPGGGGSNDSPPSGGSGGQGFLTDISGTPTWYAGGGGGGGNQSGNASNLGSPGRGGDGGGGQGGMAVPSGTVNPSFSAVATPGADGLGGGGGGGSNVSGFYEGANGGSGIVIVRYTVQGDGAGSDEPVVSLLDAHYDGDLVIGGTYRVAWAGEGADGADVFIKWGYSPSALTHTVSVATDAIGTGTFAIDIPVDQTTIYLRAFARNGEDEGVSDELKTVYIPEYDGEVPGDSTIPQLSAISASHVDGIFATISGTVTSYGEAGEGEDPITGCVVYAYLGTSSSMSRMVKQDEMAVTANVAFDYAVTNLVPNTTYYWYFEARNTAGHVIATAVDSFTTPERSLLSAHTTAVNQQTFSISGSLQQVGAGTTYILVRWNDGAWGDWTLVRTVDANSANSNFSTTFRRETWGNVSWQLISSNECFTVEGEPTGIYWAELRNGSLNATDTGTYTWKDDDGEWSGNWNDPAHWNCNKADNPGFPNVAGASVSFANCTLANPVVVHVNGKYTIGTFTCVGDAASDVTFAGDGRSNSQISCGTLPESKAKSGTRIVFKDLTLLRNSGTANWSIALGASGPTDLLLRFSGVTSTGIAHFVLAAARSRLEVVDGSSVTITGKLTIGGQDTVALFDDSTFQSGDFFAPADAPGACSIVFRGAAPLLKSTTNFGTWSNPEPLRIVFSVPRGGYATPPIQHTHETKLFAQNGGTTSVAVYSKYSFEIDPQSPALADTKNLIEDNVLVQTSAGFSFANLDEGLGTVPSHKGEALGAFQLGAGGAPLAEGAANSAARQILLDLRGYPHPSILMVH